MPCEPSMSDEPLTFEEIRKRLPEGRFSAPIQLLQRLHQIADVEMYGHMPIDMIARTVLCEVKWLAGQFDVDLDQQIRDASAGPVQT